MEKQSITLSIRLIYLLIASQSANISKCHTMQIVDYSQQKIYDEIIDINQNTNMLLLTNCGLKQLKMIHLTFEYLTFLDISSNSLTSIDILQQLCPYIRALHAQYNKLQEFSIDLKHLQYLNLQNNQLVDIQVPKQVQHLNLQSNQLIRVDLSLNSSLREINVSKNVNLRYLTCSQADVLDVSTTSLSIQCLSDLVRGRIHFLRMDRMLIIDQDSSTLLKILSNEALEMPKPWADQILTADGDEIVSRGTQHNIRGTFILHTFYTSQYFAQITQAFNIPDSEQQQTSIRCPINRTALDNWANGQGTIPFCEIVLDENVRENQQLITEYNEKLQEYKNQLIKAAQLQEAAKKKAKKSMKEKDALQNTNNVQTDKNNNEHDSINLIQLTPEEVEQGYANLSEMINGLFSLNIYGIKSRDHMHVQALQHQIDLLVYYNYNIDLFYPLPRIQLSGWEITVCKVAKNLKLTENGTVSRLRLVGCDLGLLNIERLGPYIKQLTIINCGIQHVSQLKILQSYYRLETLNIYDGLQITDFNISLIRIILNDCVSLETVNGNPIDITGGTNILSNTTEDILLHTCQQKSIEKLGYWSTLQEKIQSLNKAFQ